MVGMGRGHLKKLFSVLVITRIDAERLHHKAGVFRTLFFIVAILYINEELLEDFRFVFFFFPGVTPRLNSAFSPPSPSPVGKPVEGLWSIPG